MEEFVIDESNPKLYAVSYRLPYTPNVNPGEYYSRAEYVMPLGDMFRLYVTGLHEKKLQGDKVAYELSYPTLCLETSWSVLVPGLQGLGPDSLAPYKAASITIGVDGTPQPYAQITSAEQLIRIPSRDGVSTPT